MNEIRCSSLPRLSACAASVVAPDLRVEPPRDAADLGSAFHAVMCVRLGGAGAGVYKVDPVDEIAAEFNVDAADLAPMAGWAWRVWQDRLAVLFPSPAVEMPLRAEDAEAGLVLNGTPDLIALAGAEVRGLDWKSGWATVDATEQMKGYGLLGLLKWPEAQTARISILRVREQRVETFVWTRGDLLAWWGWLAGHLAEADVFRPGEWCGRCPRALSCEGHARSMRAVANFIADEGLDVGALQAEDLGYFVGCVRQLQKRLESFITAAKAEVEAHGGSYGPLNLVKQEQRSIDVARGLDVLKEAVGETALTQLLKISKGDVEELVKAPLSRGQKGAAVKALMERLDRAGALTVKTITKLEVLHRHGTTSSTSEPAAIGTDHGTAAAPSA